MKKIKVEIKGETPYLMHAFPLVKAEEKEKQRPGVGDFSKEIEESLYRLPDGTIYVPSTQIHSCLIEAGKNFYIPGKRKSTYGSLIGGLVLISPDALVMDPQSYVVDARAVVVPATKGRVVRYRPKFVDWRLEFCIENLEPEQVPCSTIKRILDYGGSYVGIGDFRPRHRGPFGRFIVTRFVEEDGGGD